MVEVVKGKKQGDAASFVDDKGVESNSELHEQMVAGVDDTYLRKAGADRLVKAGKITKEKAYAAVGVPLSG